MAHPPLMDLQSVSFFKRALVHAQSGTTTIQAAGVALAQKLTDVWAEAPANKSVSRINSAKKIPKNFRRWAEAVNVKNDQARRDVSARKARRAQDCRVPGLSQSNRQVAPRVGRSWIQFQRPLKVIDRFVQLALDASASPRLLCASTESGISSSVARNARTASSRSRASRSTLARS